MEKLIKSIKLSILAVSATLLASCSSGFDYDHSTATLTFVKGNIKFGELEPVITADELIEIAKVQQKAGKTTRAYNTYKKIATEYQLSTRAPEAYYEMAKIDEAKGKQGKAFAHYQALITTYLDTPLYKPSLERQWKIAHKAATGGYDKKFLFLTSKVAPAISDKYLQQFIENAPHGQHAAHAQFLRAKLKEDAKILDQALLSYRDVTRDHPESKYAGEALFRIGSILYKQSQQGNVNLDNSKRAIEVFEELTSIYPKHSRTKEAKDLVKKISGYDLKRSLEVAQFYTKKAQYTSALFYYNDIIARTKATSELHKQAKAGVEAVNALKAAQQ